MSTVTRAARNSLLWLLAIVVGLAGAVAYEAIVNDQPLTPGLALDLAGGTEITLKATTTDGSEITQDTLDQSVAIIRKRVDASGVAEAEITTQGTDFIIVSLPGSPYDATKDLVTQTAQLQFRPVIYADTGIETTLPDFSVDPVPAFDGTASSYEWITDQVKADFLALDCTDPNTLKAGDIGPHDGAFASCNYQFGERLLLGPVEMDGADVSNATAGPSTDTQGNIKPNDYEVRLELTGDGATKFDEITGRMLPQQSPRNRFAIVLDGEVISAPNVLAHIRNGIASISGSFTTPESALSLANQLKFGALPLQLEPQSDKDVAATLGAEYLERGLIAGAIGLVLVVLYSLLQYRVLGFVTVASLAIAGFITYASITYLSGLIGYRLSLAGIAGVIVAIGVTADSFIVYFERVRDELRDGRSLPASVEHGWSHARRTILASDSVSFLASVVLYLTAVGGVRGFAFTLGLTTIVDLVVVMLFTHPLLGLLARTRFFGGGHPLSGLDPRQLGRESFYKGRGRVAGTATLAERKAAERAKETAKAGAVSATKKGNA